MSEFLDAVGVRGPVPRQPLTERQRAILKLIVQEYSGTGRAVGSKTLTERYAVGVSPATIRNEMAELESFGLVEHLHADGGRDGRVERIVNAEHHPEWLAGEHRRAWFSGGIEDLES